MRIMTLCLLMIFMFTVSGCQTSVYRTRIPIPGNNIYLDTIHCKDQDVGQIIANAIQIELLKKGLHFTNYESANMILTGTAVFTTASMETLGGFASSGAGGIYGAGYTKTYINSATFYVKDKNDGIIAIGSYKVTPDWDAPLSPVEIGQKVGEKLAKKIFKKF